MLQLPKRRKVIHGVITTAQSGYCNSYASTSTVAWVILQKYGLAVSLYWQENEWRDLGVGVSLSRATMSNWILASYRDWLSPIVELLKQKLLEQGYLHIDEYFAQKRI